jgi:hypothetical protein
MLASANVQNAKVLPKYVGLFTVSGRVGDGASGWQLQQGLLLHTVSLCQSL